MKQTILGLLASSLFLMSFSFTAEADDCDLEYNMSGWSILYESYKGSGVVTCPNGRALVELRLTGIGVTFGTAEISDGKGKIRGVKGIEDIYVEAFQVGGNAGFNWAADGRWIPRGKRDITLSGTGAGFTFGFSLGSFEIRKP
ncbi:MAG: hypothetical protein K9L22_11360 [Methylococcaceae bacterium]|nr:hypothetical protein [Methylococcaceae bacterium]